MQSRGRGPEPGEGAPGDFRVESQGWDFTGQAQRLQLRRIPRSARGAPGQPRAGSGSAKSRSEGGRAPAKWWGSGLGLGWKRRACGAWIPAPFGLECSVRSAVLPPGKEQSNCSLPKEA